MGSVVITHTVHDTAHYPRTMLADNAHRQEHQLYDRSSQSTPQSSTSATRNRSHSRHTSSTPVSSQRHSSTSSHQDATPSQAIPARESAPPPSEPAPKPIDARTDSSSTTFTSQTENSVPELISDNSSSVQTSPSTSFNDGTSASGSPQKIKIKDLKHIQSFLDDESNPFGFSRPSSRQADAATQPPQFEISAMPIADVIEMVAGLLTKITTTNDKQHQHLHRSIPPGEAPSSLNQQTSSVLAFHGKNVPSITILSYLARIHKYCPTTYEVFISLLVYFDRMTDKVNSAPIQSLRDAQNEEMEQDQNSPLEARNTDAHDYANGSNAEVNSEDAAALIDVDPSLAHFFVVDSFNIHRLVIAAVTCASKYFSDVFYTNSRYAKVGGLPLVELNHLELQFLLLNDFRLAVPVEELEAYATMLVEFYAREVLAQREEEKLRAAKADSDAMEGVESTQSSSA